MRYAFISYILILQLLWQTATEPKLYPAAGKALQEESTGISASSVTLKHYGEITPVIQFHGTVSKVSGQRLHDGWAAILNLSNYLSIQVSKATNALSSPPRFPFVRRLLFPHHYFW